MLRHWIEVTESLLNEVDVFLVVLDTTGNDEALSWRNVSMMNCCIILASMLSMFLEVPSLGIPRVL